MKTKKVSSIVLAFLMVLVLSSFLQEEAAAEKNPSLLNGKLNINTATARQFSLLNGIGKKTADNIVEYRAKNGNFKSTEDLCKIKGIGKKTLEQNKKYLVVEGETTLRKAKK